MSVESRQKLIPELENRSNDLYPVVLDRLPNLYQPPNISNSDQTVFASPQSFDELLKKQRDFQEYKVVLKRKPEVQQSLDMNQEISRKLGFSPIETYLEKYLQKEKFLLTLNRFPYNVPEDTKHLIAWYRGNTPPSDLSQFLASKFSEYTIGEDDFVFYRNLPTRMSVPRFDHLQILVRK